MKSKQKLVSEFRRAEIVDAARSVFARRGFARGIMDEIAKEAGIAKGTIYLYFRSKTEVYKAVLSKWAEGDYSERRSTIGWPPVFDDYVERSYKALKAEQTRLLHSFPWRVYHRIADRKTR